MRRRRKRILSALVAALKHYADHELRTFTIMNANWLFSPKELEEITAAVIKNGFRSHLNFVRITDMPGPFLCFLDGEFETTSGNFSSIYTASPRGKKQKRLTG